MENDLISVIVPVFNTEIYLAPCLDSILNQSYRNLEVIVIDDGSGDYSLQIAQSYSQKDDRVHVYPYSNEGLSVARNRGLEVATGDYIIFVDSDDLLLENAIEILYNFIKKTDADLVEGEYIRGKVFHNILPKKKIESITFTPEQAMADTLYQKKLIPSAWGKLYKKNLFNDLYFEKGILYEDLNIFYKVLERCKKIIWIDFPVYFYRVTEGSILNSWNPKRLDVLKVTEKIESYMEEKYPDLLPAAKDRRLSANFNMFALCSIHRDHENATKCWDYIKKNRFNSFLDPKVRKKNKAGIILSYFGRKIFNLAARKIYR